MKNILTFGIAVLMVVIIGSCSSPKEASAQSNSQANKDVVNSFFDAIEAQKFEVIKEIFDVNAKQLIPYAPEGFPKILDGSEAIFNQFSGLTAFFDQMKFRREIFTTEDPNLIFVKFKGNMDVKGGGKYQNDYLGTFKFKDGKIVEYTEYFNPIIMAKAFNIKL